MALANLLQLLVRGNAVPFSFICEGRSSDQMLTRDPDSPRVYTALRGGLRISTELREFRTAGCVEWHVKIRNTGASRTPNLRDVCALDVPIPVPESATPTIYYSRGCALGIESFMLCARALNRGESLRIDNPSGGKTVDFLPFFNLDLGGHGIIGAVGWPGRWFIRFDRERPDSIRLRAGMDRISLALEPGEEIRTPSVLLLVWEGDRLAAHNVLRRHILEHHTPTSGGQQAPDLVCCPTWGGMKTANHLKLIEMLREQMLDYDCYWVDAGWYGPDHACEEYQNLLTGDWYFHVGDWRANPSVHPQGLKPISEAAHAAGMKFLLWFEPERAMAGSPLLREHPEWFFKRTPEGTLAGRPYRWRCFNFGIPEARRWMTDWISNGIVDLGIDIFRQDCNFGPAKSWDDEDAADRVGISEIRYVEGLLEFWDELRRRFPHLILDLAQRRDLESMARGLDLYRSDYSGNPYADPIGGQISLHGISHWMPLTGTGGPVRPGDTYSLLSDLCPCLALPVFSAVSDKPVVPRPPGDYAWDWHRAMMTLHRMARPFFRGDFYPLVRATTSPDTWSAVQFHRPDLDAGMVLVYCRPESPYVVARFPLHGLAADIQYEIEDTSGGVRIADGKELLSPGLQAASERRRSASIIFYRGRRG